LLVGVVIASGMVKMSRDTVSKQVVPGGRLKIPCCGERLQPEERSSVSPWSLKFTVSKVVPWSKLRKSLS